MMYLLLQPNARSFSALSTKLKTQNVTKKVTCDLNLEIIKFTLVDESQQNFNSLENPISISIRQIDKL